MFRGSRKHVLDWTARPQFIPELLAMVEPVRCKVTSASRWQPLGYHHPAEARLEHFGPSVAPDHPAWADLSSWWLKHQRGANTPNWDIALYCEVQDRPGLILVEAKANVPELSEAGKWQNLKASERSAENHERIRAAILEAQVALRPLLDGISIDRDRHYQLSNRIAFAWKLASLGIPIVLVYLGFVGDAGIADVGEPFNSSEHWNETFCNHLSSVCPLTALNRPIDAGAAPFWVLSRSRPVLEISKKTVA